MNEIASASLSPAEQKIAAVAASSEVRLTPCGEGSMVWHVWGAGSGKPNLVLLHGGYGSWIHWIRNVLPLSEHFTVHAADLPGLGESARPPNPRDPYAMAPILAEGIETVVQDAAPYDVVGFSFGSIMGGHAAIHLGDRLKSLTLVGAGGMGLSRQPAEDMVRLMPTMTQAELETHARKNLSILMCAHPETIDDVAIHMQILNSMRAVARSRGISRAGTLKEVLPKIRTTLRGIWGELDSTSIGYLDERRDLLRAIQPGIDFRVIPNAGHWVAYEAADAFNAMVIDMLRPGA